jgi:hypothetical protein
MSIGIGILESSRSVSSGTLILDLYPNAAAAFSFRKLRTAYSGFCIRVASSASGNPTADIGFVSNVLDTAALLAFAGSNTCRVMTWYDQSGNGNNATQSTFADACIIVNAGTLVTDGGKAAITGNKFYLLNSNIVPNSDFTAFSVMSRTSSTGIIASFCGAIVPYISFCPANTNVYNANNVREQFYGFNLTGRFLFSTTNVAYVINAYINNILQTLVVNSTQIIAGNFDRIMGRSASQSLQGKTQEHILYNTNQAANNTAINTDINTYYSIY